MDGRWIARGEATGQNVCRLSEKWIVLGKSRDCVSVDSKAKVSGMVIKATNSAMKLFGDPEEFV